MSELKNIKAKNIEIDYQGRVVIDDQEFADQIKKRLENFDAAEGSDDFCRDYACDNLLCAG